MADVLILGAGVMGTAFSFPLSDAGCSVRLVGTHLDEFIIDELNASRPHPNLGMKAPEGVSAYHNDELEKVIDGIDLIVLGVSSAGVDWSIERLAESVGRQIPIIMLTKGLAVSPSGELEILPDRVARGVAPTALAGAPVGAVGGPCIAGELAARRQTGVTIGFREDKARDSVRGMVDSSYYHCAWTRDLAGLEACAALKNFYALAVGAAAGMLDVSPAAENGALMNNPAALLFSQCLDEMEYIVGFMGGLPESVRGRPGTGDFYVTCLAGRNSRMGRLLGRGQSYREAKEQHMPEDTVEGAELALQIGQRLQTLVREDVLEAAKLPVTLSLIKSICDDEYLHLPWELL